MQIALFDLDGTLRQTRTGKTFIEDPRDQRPIDGVLEMLNKLRDKGYIILGITNQGGVDAGFKTRDSCIIEQQITLYKLPQLAGIYVCMDKGESCDYITAIHDEVQIKTHTLLGNYRKPGSGMLSEAVSHREDLSKVFYCGDRLEDAQAAADLGIKFVQHTDIFDFVDTL